MKMYDAIFYFLMIRLCFMSLHAAWCDSGEDGAG